MKKGNLLNDVFEDKGDTQPDRNRTTTVNKFLECFGSAGRHKQIRILQIGSSGPTTLTKKPFLTTQPIKKPFTGLFNNEILFRPRE